MKVMLSVLVGFVVYRYVIEKMFGSWFAKASSYVPSL